MGPRAAGHVLQRPSSAAVAGYAGTADASLGQSTLASEPSSFTPLLSLTGNTTMAESTVLQQLNTP